MLLENEWERKREKGRKRGTSPIYGAIRSTGTPSKRLPSAPDMAGQDGDGCVVTITTVVIAIVSTAAMMLLCRVIAVRPPMKPPVPAFSNILASCLDRL
ncbi:hypothetical protein E2C01_065302 [Portunus trituberculatus]|uniref:Uncharacterized protein n=1 Tax=Portunus trituberculatus TaxID=210409 RepID=A0A5B7HN12_PORTR|nr:hypothetical protein [Portunus trituberculatus]